MEEVEISDGEGDTFVDMCSYRYWEPEDHEVQSIEDNLQQNVRNAIEFWEKELEAPEWILKTISKGYSIEKPEVMDLKVYPVEKFQGPKLKFLGREMERLALIGAVLKLEAGAQTFDGEEVHFFPVHLVPKREGVEEFRLIYNLKQFNTMLNTPTFSTDTIKNVMQLIKPGWFMCKIDIKDGFYHIGLARAEWRWMGFKINETSYMFKAMPMGCQKSPFVFCQMIKVLTRYFRRHGIVCVQYVDDFWFAAETFEKLAEIIQFVLKIFNKAGIKVNMKKSILTPVERIIFLGYIISTVDNCCKVFVEGDRIFRIILQLQLIIEAKSVWKKKLAEVCGKLISFKFAFPFAQPFVAGIFRLFGANPRWNIELDIPKTIKDDLEILVELLKGAQPVKFNRVPTKHIFTDASLYGFGGWILNQPLSSNIAQHWVDETSHINNLEGLAVLNCIKLWIENKIIIAGDVISLNVDSMVFLGVMTRNVSKHKKLNDILKQIWLLTLKYDVAILKHTYVKSEANLADANSRNLDYADWKFVGLKKIQQFFNVEATIDRFADGANRLCKKFNSRFICAETSGVDALAQNDWNDEVNLVVPPFALVDQVMTLVSTLENAICLLVIPETNQWTPFWIHSRPWMKLSKWDFVQGASKKEPEPWMMKGQNMVAIL